MKAEYILAELEAMDNRLFLFESSKLDVVSPLAWNQPSSEYISSLLDGLGSTSVHIIYENQLRRGFTPLKSGIVAIKMFTDDIKRNTHDIQNNS